MDWFLTNAWLIPLLPSLSFVVILLFGKRLPKKGSEVGVGAVAISFVLAIGTAIAWIRRAPTTSAQRRSTICSCGSSLGPPPPSSAFTSTGSP